MDIGLFVPLSSYNTNAEFVRSPWPAVCFAFGRDDLLTTLDRLVTEVLEPAAAAG
jgi:hypothetical protein